VWMNVGQGEAEVGAEAALAVATPAAPVDPGPSLTAPAAQPSAAPAAAVAAAEPPKPAKKSGGFKAWLNADQPKADGKKPGGSKGDKKT